MKCILIANIIILSVCVTITALICFSIPYERSRYSTQYLPGHLNITQVYSNGDYSLLKYNISHEAATPQYAAIFINGHLGDANAFDTFASVYDTLSSQGQLDIYVIDHHSLDMAFSAQKTASVAQFLLASANKLTATYSRIALIGFSYGGLVVKYSTTFPGFPLSYLSMMVTINSPLLEHPFKIENQFSDIYKEIEKQNYSSPNVTQLCITGGSHDRVVPFSRYGCDSKWSNAKPITISSFENVWNDYQHDSVMWDSWFSTTLAKLLMADQKGENVYNMITDLASIITNNSIKSKALGAAEIPVRYFRDEGYNYMSKVFYNQSTLYGESFKLSNKTKKHGVFVIVRGFSQINLYLRNSSSRYAEELEWLYSIKSPLNIAIAKLQPTDLVDNDELLVSFTSDKSHMRDIKPLDRWNKNNSTDIAISVARDPVFTTLELEDISFNGYYRKFEADPSIDSSYLVTYNVTTNLGTLYSTLLLEIATEGPSDTPIIIMVGRGVIC